MMRWKPGMAMTELEREAIERTLEHFDGNKIQAAAALQINVRTIRRKVRRLTMTKFEKPHGRPKARR